MTAENQTTVKEFVGQESDTGQSAESTTVTDNYEEKLVLFRLSDDPFVNEAAAEIGRQLANQGLAEVTPTQVVTVPDVDPDLVATWIEKLCTRALSNTHRRKTIAHQVNGVLKSVGQGSDDDRWVPPPGTYFPERDDDDQTIYPNDEVSTEVLDANGVPPEQVEYIDSDPTQLYQLSATYVGNPSGHKFNYQLARYERYLESYIGTIAGEFSPDDHACMLCGSNKMPTTKDTDGNKLEYNQSFDIRSTASAVSRPLGMGGRDTAHQGRCAACLIAGFYYTLMPKVVRFKDREKCGGNFPIPVHRIFTPRGDLETLANIRRDFDRGLLVSIGQPTSNDRARRGTLPATSTKSRGLQTLQFYESILRHVNKVRTQNYYEITVEHRPTGLISYTSAQKKSGNFVRDIREVETIDPDTWAYGAVQKRSISNGGPDSADDDEYWPFEDLLDWYARLEGWYRRRNQDGPVNSLDDIAYGVLERDLKQLERGHFEIAKALEQEQGANAPYVLPIKRAADYFTHIMQHTTQDTAERIDEEAIESIKRVASNVGEMFYERDDISVLIALQNASTSDEFLQAFEKASMQAQKKASADNGGTYSWSGKNDVAQVLQLINDPDTFESAKRMFVIHASLAAQYMNAQRGSENGD